MGDLTRPDAVVVARTVDASPDALSERLTQFALDYGLQLDRRHEGDELKFVRKADMPVDGKELFRTGDELYVLVTRERGESHIVCEAVMKGLHQRGEEWKRGRAVRGALLSALFVYLSVQGFAHGVDLGDFVLGGLAVMFGSRTARAVRHEHVDRAAFEDDVHLALTELCDELELGGG